MIDPLIDFLTRGILSENPLSRIAPIISLTQVSVTEISVITKRRGDVTVDTPQKKKIFQYRISINYKGQIYTFTKFLENNIRFGINNLQIQLQNEKPYNILIKDLNVKEYIPTIKIINK